MIDPREMQRLRPADLAHTRMIMVSMRDNGQFAPVLVRHAPRNKNGKQPYVLAAGLHRLRAAQRLGWSDICAMLLEPEDDPAVVEIEENLCRADLTALDRIRFIRERRELFEAEHGPIKRGGPPKGHMSLWGGELDDIAGRLGLSLRTLKRADRIGGVLWGDDRRHANPELVAALRGTEAENSPAMLMKIALLDPYLQTDLIFRIEKGESAKKALATLTAKETPAPGVVLHNRVMGALNGADRGELIELFEDIWRQYGDELCAARAAIDAEAV